ncbi:hypothetical protein JCM10212_005809 [Sporobolomyces blumeae]
MPQRNLRVTVLISGSGSNLQALIDALPTTLNSCTITSVISSRSDAYGLVRASTSSIPNEPFPLLKWKKQPSNQGKQRTDWELELADKILETRPDLVVLAGWMLILSEAFLNRLRRTWHESDPLPTRSSLPCLVDPSSTPQPSTTPTTTTGSSSSSSQPRSLFPTIETPGESPYPPTLDLEGKPIPIINLHPALPGQFPGAHAIEDAWNAFNTPDDATFITASNQAVKETLEHVADSSSNDPTPPGEGDPVGLEPRRRITKTGLMVHRVIPLLDAGEPVVVKEVEMKEGESLSELEERIHKVEHVAIVEAVKACEGLIRSGEWWNTQ